MESQGPCPIESVAESEGGTAGADDRESRRQQVAERSSLAGFSRDRNDAGYSGEVREEGHNRGRGRAPNCNEKDAESLLDCVKKKLPLGANEWAVVAALHAAEARKRGRPVRDQKSIRKNFDKLASRRKPTGDPACPPEVHRAKQIARDILQRCSAWHSNSGGSDEEEAEVESAEAGERLGNSTSTGSQGRRPSVGERSSLTSSVGLLVEQVGSMADALKAETERDAGESVRQLSRDDVVSIAREELKETNETLAGMKRLLEAIASGRGQQ